MNNIQANQELFNKSYNEIKTVLIAAQKSPYYANLFYEIGFNPQAEFSYFDFMKIPISDKKMYAENKLSMMSVDITEFDKNHYHCLNEEQRKEYLKSKGILLKITSGSTGEPFELFRTQKENMLDYLMFSKNRKLLTDYSFKGQFLWLWPVNPVLRKRMQLNGNNLVKVNSHGDMFYLFEYSNETMEELYNLLCQRKYEWITAPPSGLCNFADYILKNNLAPIKFKYIECHSEYMFEWQRDLITKVFFSVPVSIYSSNEVQFMGGTCKNGIMHIFSNVCFIECVDSGRGSEVYVTSLLYKQFPIIRYKLGDKCDWTIENVLSNCNLSKFPAIKMKEYRANDYIVRPGGKLIEPFVITDSVFFLLKDRHYETFKYRVIQKEIDLFVYFLPNELLKDAPKIIEYLENYLGDVFLEKVKVVLEVYSQEDNASKFKYFVSEVDL